VPPHETSLPNQINVPQESAMKDHSFSNLDFFHPSWLEKHNDEKIHNQKQPFNINVNVSKKSVSGFCMNNLDRSPQPSQLSKRTWTETEELFSRYDPESGFHVSSNVLNDNDFFGEFGDFRRLPNKNFNLKEEEFPGLGEVPPPEPKKTNVQPEERYSEKKSKGKKVKMVSYTGNTKENSPSKQAETKVPSQPGTYSHAVKTPKDCQIMVAGLPSECLESEVLSLMEPFGQVVYINIQKDPSGYSSAIIG
jgi:hypothetical protein